MTELTVYTRQDIAPQREISAALFTEFVQYIDRGEATKSIYFCFIDYAKSFDCVDHNKLWKILRDGNTRPPDLTLEKPMRRWRRG